MKCKMCKQEMHHQYWINVKTGNRYFSEIPDEIIIDAESEYMCRNCELSSTSHEYHTYRIVGSDVPPAFKSAFGS